MNASKTFRIGGRALVQTGIVHRQRRVYRMIGRDLYSAPLHVPFSEQVYTLERSDVLEARQTGMPWQVVVRDGEVCLES